MLVYREKPDNTPSLELSRDGWLIEIEAILGDESADRSSVNAIASTLHHGNHVEPDVPGLGIRTEPTALRNP